MIRIGVVSDTHIPTRAKALPSILFQAFSNVDMILHAGDLATLDVLIDLEALAPVHAVYGNVDPPEVMAKLPKKKEIVVEGVTIGLIHGDGPGGNTVRRAQEAFPHADCIVFGHSHDPLCRQEGRTLLFNPGSPTDRRRQPDHSYGFLTVSNGRIEGEIVRFRR